MIIDRNNLTEEIRDLPESHFEIVGTEVIRDEAFKTEPVGFLKDAISRLRKNRLSVIAFWVIMAVIASSIIVPSLTGYTYNEQNVAYKNLPPKVPGFKTLGILDGTREMTNRRKDGLNDPTQYPPGTVIEIVREYVHNKVEMVDVKVDFYRLVGVPEGRYYWMGTDYLGRDLCTRLFLGARISLIIAFFSVVSNICIGIIYGACSGYYGGKVDMVLTHFAEMLDGLPYLVVTILFMILLGTGMVSIILALTVTGWIGTSRLVRAQFYRFKGREYVLAARTLGVKDRALIFRHILPNAMGPIITRAMISIPGAIFSESFLAYIGLGIKPPSPSIGILLSDGQKVLLQYPYQTVFPAVLISVLMVSFNLFANGLRDALDPTQRGEV